MLTEILVKILMRALENATPEIRQVLSEYLDAFEKKAAATDNPFDDILVMVLKGLAGF